MPARITDALVKALEEPARGQKIVFDTIVKGFGIRIRAGGARSFILEYRTTAGRQRRYRIGSYPSWTVEKARREARTVRNQVVDAGRDPMGERHDVRTAPTVNDLADRYMKEHAPRKRTGEDDRRIWEKHIKPQLGRTKVADVRYADIEKLHRGMASTPYHANRVRALLSKMFSLAIKWEMRSDNPCIGVERFAEDRRERFLSQKELVRLFEALTTVPASMTEKIDGNGRVNSERERRLAATAADAIRLLILTGARRSEVLRATWDQFDLAAGVWVKPSSHTKQKKPHRVPLSAPALQVLVGMKERSPGKWICPGKVDGEPLTDLKKFWRRVCKVAKLEAVRVHDLRHTYASILASRGASLTMVGALLGHTQPSTTARYAHLFDDPLREATEAVGAFVNDATVLADRAGQG